MTLNRWAILAAVLGAAGCGSGGGGLASAIPTAETSNVSAVHREVRAMDQAVRGRSVEAYLRRFSESYHDGGGMTRDQVQSALQQWETITLDRWTITDRSFQEMGDGHIIERTTGTLGFHRETGSEILVPMDYVETWSKEGGVWYLQSVETSLTPGTGRMFDPYPSS